MSVPIICYGICLMISFELIGSWYASGQEEVWSLDGPLSDDSSSYAIVYPSAILFALLARQA